MDGWIVHFRRVVVIQCEDQVLGTVEPAQISLKTDEISRFQRHLRFDEPCDEVTRAIEFGIEPLTQSFRIETSTSYNGTSIRLDEPQLILCESDHTLAFFARNCADAV